MARFCFCLRNLWYLRTLAPAIDRLAARGHELQIAVLEDDIGQSDIVGLQTASAHVAELQARYPSRISVASMSRSKDGWSVLDMIITRLIDFFHFRNGLYHGKPHLVARVKGPPPLRKLLGLRLFQSSKLAGVAAPFLAAIERRLPGDPLAEKFFRSNQPDLLVFSPLIDLGLSQFSQLRAARRAGLRTALIVNSWDNLSSKAWIRDAPDAITVWNDIQAHELKHFHRVKKARVSVTGAPHFDPVFEFKPSESRHAFFSRLGLDETRPLVVYVASATLRSKHDSEVDFVEQWLGTVRSSSDERLAKANVIVRPHPKRRNDWLDAAARFGASALVWPPVAENPVHRSSVEEYLTTLAYSDAIVGLNTSAFLEGAVIGRPVHAILDPRFAHSQTETFHFGYLVGERSGILRVAYDLESHAADLVKTLADPHQTPEERSHLLSFVRPLGAHVSAIDVLVSALEEAARVPLPSARAQSLVNRTFELAMWPLAMVARRLYERDLAVRRMMKHV